MASAPSSKKSRNVSDSAGFDRRGFLRGSGAMLALPWLGALQPPWRRTAEPKRRLVAIELAFSLHPSDWFPEQAGRDYALTPYLEVLKDFRDDLTVFSGLSHPGVDGGHFSEPAFLTGAPHPSSNFKNSVSLDQVFAEQVHEETRFGYLALATGPGSVACSRSGVLIPAEQSPSKLFDRLFVDGTPDEVARQRRSLHAGQSVMDTVLEEARRLQGRLDANDRDRLQDYLAAVRATEQELGKAQDWTHRPKPHVDDEPPVDVTSPADVIGRARQMYHLIELALRTDSSRAITLKLAGTSIVPPIEGVTQDYHNLTHHGQDPGKIAQLRLIETAHLRALADFLGKLRDIDDGDGSLLDHTIVLFGSNLGNGNSHSTKNLPILVAGGGFQHGQHLAFDQDHNEPLANLFVTILQRLGVGAERFSSSTGPLAGFELR